MDRDLIIKAAEGITYEENVSTIAYENIIFFSLAEGGAMGCPGEVLIATKTNEAVKWYCLNCYLYGKNRKQHIRDQRLH